MEGTTCLGRRQNLPEDHLIFHTLEKLQTKMAERFSLNSHIVSSVIYSDQHLYEISLEEWNLFAGKMRARKKIWKDDMAQEISVQGTLKISFIFITLDKI